MARRALIIAIEHYAQMEEGLAPRLEGTHQSALEFRQWLVDEQGVQPADIELCTEDPTVPGRTAGATRKDVEDVLDRLRTAGRNMTEHFYAYLAGHGFTYTDIDALHLADVLLLQDYCRRRISGSACLKIDTVRTWLRRALGPGEHFYFVDCCRNLVGQNEIRCSDLGLAYDAANNGDPTIHTLYSTIEGAVAAVGSGFCRVLISGLKGTGRAKVWLEDYRGMAVKFVPVSQFVAQRLTGQPVADDKWGQGEGVIREFIPAPCYELKVVVENAGPGDTFTVNASTARGQKLAPVSFTGPEWTFKAWPPDTYLVTLSTPGHDVEALDPGPADLYETCPLRFRKGPQLPAAPAPAPPPPITVRAPDGTTLRILGLTRPEVIERIGEFTGSLPTDRYQCKVLDDRGVLVAQQEFVVEPGRAQEVDLRGFVKSPLRDALLARLPHDGGLVDFSETLRGPTPDQGLDLWLAIVGAARILQGTPDDFSKLGPLPLASFFNIPAHGAPVYVLAGFDEPPEGVVVTLDGARQWIGPHPELPGLFEVPVPRTVASSHLLTLAVDGLAPLTLATASVSNRATLVTFSRHAGEAIRIRQLILPIPHLIPHLVRPPLWRTSPLGTVRRSVEVQRQFEGGRELSALLREDELIDLLYFKWTEAVMCVLGAYELARRGRAQLLGEAAGNLQVHFPELPDSHAIARLAGLGAAPPEFPPLVLDGLLDVELPVPLPPDAELDFRGPWTLWRGGF